MRMHTFLQITQAVFNLSFSNNVPVVYLDGSYETNYDFCKTQIENEALLPIEKKRGVEKQFFMMYVLKNWVTAKTKLQFFKETMENMFINDKTRVDFIAYYTKIQRTYHILSKFAYRYRHRITPILINKDMYLNILDEKQARVFSMVQNNKKYLFSITDLINIINSSLGNSFFFVSEPLPCKNPYTNLPFNKSTLYNIYFFIKSTSFIMPQLFHEYFKTNFNLRIFGEVNEEAIRDYSIKQYVNNAEIEELHDEILNIIENDRYGKKLKIDAEFPKERLVNIMRPYLELYYKGTYTSNETKREKYVRDFNCKMKNFYLYNKQFGRRYFKRAFLTSEPFLRKHKYEVSFDDNHSSFYANDLRDDFQTSHIHIFRLSNHDD